MSGRWQRVQLIAGIVGVEWSAWVDSVGTGSGARAACDTTGLISSCGVVERATDVAATTSFDVPLFSTGTGRVLLGSRTRAS
jgi:hypothetical protein